MKGSLYNINKMWLWTKLVQFLNRNIFMCRYLEQYYLKALLLILNEMSEPWASDPRTWLNKDSLLHLNSGIHKLRIPLFFSYLVKNHWCTDSGDKNQGWRDSDYLLQKSRYFIKMDIWSFVGTLGSHASYCSWEQLIILVNHNWSQLT